MSTAFKKVNYTNGTTEEVGILGVQWIVGVSGGIRVCDGPDRIRFYPWHRVSSALEVTE